MGYVLTGKSSDLLIEGAKKLAKANVPDCCMNFLLVAIVMFFKMNIKGIHSSARFVFAWKIAKRGCIVKAMMRMVKFYIKAFEDAAKE